MKMILIHRFLRFVFVLTLVTGCKSRSFSDAAGSQDSPDWPVDNRHEYNGAPVLSQTPRNSNFQREIATINSIFASNDPAQRARLSFKPKNSGGTSCYVRIYLDGALEGLFSPAGNGAGNIEAEANSWSLARLFEAEDAFQPAGYVDVPQWGQDLFLKSLECSGSDPLFAENRRNVQSNLGKAHVRFLIKRWDYQPTDLEDDGESVFKFLKDTSLSLDGAQSLNGSSQDRRVLAKEFFIGLLVDVYQGQWDRFSGGNVQSALVQGKLHIAWFDNGGAEFYPSDAARNALSSVRRIHKKTYETVRQLDAFLSAERPAPFRGFADRKMLRDALLFIDMTSWEQFKKNSSWLRQNLEQKVQNGAVFF